MNNQENTKLGDFKVLSKYDDLFSDIFLDNLFLWFNTIKMNKEHRKPRVPNTKILDVIKRHVLENSKPNDAVNELLEMDYFKQYLSLKNPKQIQEFVQHLKRYLYMYMPNAGYEIGDTKRYSERKLEACLVATKDWHVGDEMKLLMGVIATLDPQQDAELKRGNRDFSVMWSTRKKCTCLFLGPARFANHDCESNCRFIAHGLNSIIFKVVKEIKCGDEITVFYGQHYFGENNCECLCVTCEKNQKGGFALPVQEQEVKPGKRPTRTRKTPVAYEDYVPSSIKRTHTSEKEEPVVRKKKLKVMSIDFICNESKSKEITVVVYPESTDLLKKSSKSSINEALKRPSKEMIKKSQDESIRDCLKEKTDPMKETVDDLVEETIEDSLKETAGEWSIKSPKESPKASPKADSAVSLSPNNKDTLEEFLDEISDLSSVDETKEAAKNKARSELKCIGCRRPLENVPEQVGADPSLVHELATWTWSPSAVFTRWCPKRCPRCERHYAIFAQEWPIRKEKKRPIKKIKEAPPLSLPEETETKESDL